jgi:RNA polymerase sigma-70 factor (ECF subfamily)
MVGLAAPREPVHRIRHRTHETMLAPLPAPTATDADAIDRVADGAACVRGRLRAPFRRDPPLPAQPHRRGARRGADTLLLVAWADLTYEETARALDVPVGTVRSRMHRTRAEVRAALRDAEEERRG